MSDLHKQLVTRNDWPAPKRNSVFYSMNQKERISALGISDWPDLDWDDQWIALFEDEPYDRQIAVDARSGALQEAFNITHLTSDNAEDYLRSVVASARQGEGIELELIECREDGKYIKDTEIPLRTYLDSESVDELAKQFDIPDHIRKRL